MFVAGLLGWAKQKARSKCKIQPVFSSGRLKNCLLREACPALLALPWAQGRVCARSSCAAPPPPRRLPESRHRLSPDLPARVSWLPTGLNSRSLIMPHLLRHCGQRDPHKMRQDQGAAGRLPRWPRWSGERRQSRSSGCAVRASTDLPGARAQIP